MLVISKIACDITRSHIIIELLTKMFLHHLLEKCAKATIYYWSHKNWTKTAEIFLMTAKH